MAVALVTLLDSVLLFQSALTLPLVKVTAFHGQTDWPFATLSDLGRRGPWDTLTHLPCCAFPPLPACLSFRRFSDLTQDVWLSVTDNWFVIGTLLLSLIC